MVHIGTVTISPELAELAYAHGVGTDYRSWTGEDVRVDEAIVRSVLRAIGVPADTPEQLADALQATRGRSLPGTITLREGGHVGPELTVTLEDGTPAEPEAPLPVGYHVGTNGLHATTIIVAPDRLAPVPRAWGWQLQLYSMHSAQSWGIGDYADLGEFCRRAAADQGAGVVLMNPVNAVSPVHPLERSPYSPASRLRCNPLYLRITDLPEFAAADEALRAKVVALAPPQLQVDDLIDYDEVWLAKRAALWLLWQQASVPRVDPGVVGFATFCALAEHHGGNWHVWPAEFHDPDGPAVLRFQQDQADEVGFHIWLQVRCDEQLIAAHGASAAMSVGIVHDLPVGTAADGADTWLRPDLFAAGVRVGAPADAFNAAGQDWGMPPWRPNRIADIGYEPFRDVVRSVLRHGDGIRVDHVAGLWRLWWIPEGEPAHRGTYVYYDAEAMLAILAIEAQRSGAIVVGEDLGTVEPRVTWGLHDRGMLSSAVLMFQHDWNAPGKPFILPEHWEPESMASITTHDLPTALGWLAAGRTRDTEAVHDLMARADVGTDDPVIAMHELIARAASRLVLTAPADAVGETRQPNMPGTTSEYPNWRIPLTLSIDEFFADERVREVIAPLRAARPHTTEES